MEVIIHQFLMIWGNGLHNICYHPLMENRTIHKMENTIIHIIYIVSIHEWYNIIVILLMILYPINGITLQNP